MMVSYAQNFEDVMLERIFRDQPTGFYIDVGAADPIQHSVTKHFYDKGWRGVNIEPIRSYWESLSRERLRDVNLLQALGVAKDNRTFYNISDEFLSTFDEQHAHAAVRMGGTCRLENVNIDTLASVCDQYSPGTIDFLKIDVEGWEEQVIRGGDWVKHRPRVLVIEATRPNTAELNYEAWDKVLVTNRYEFVYFDGLNRFYLREEDIVLRTHFQIPPNVFDSFCNYRESALEKELIEVYRQCDVAKSQLDSLLKDDQAVANSEPSESSHATGSGEEEVTTLIMECKRLREQLEAQKLELEAMKTLRPGRMAKLLETATMGLLRASPRVSDKVPVKEVPLARMKHTVREFAKRTGGSYLAAKLGRRIDKHIDHAFSSLQPRLNDMVSQIQKLEEQLDVQQRRNEILEMTVDGLLRQSSHDAQPRPS